MTKAKYQVLIENQLRHTYVTTTRNTEDMINTLRDMYEGNYKLKIIKTCEGEVKVVYGENYYAKELRTVIDVTTGREWPSARDLAISLNKSHAYVRLILTRKRKKAKNFMYKDQYNEILLNLINDTSKN